MAQATPTPPEPQPFVTMRTGIAQSQGAAESVMTCIVETRRSSLCRNENLNLFLLFSVDSCKQSCVINKMFILAVLAFTGGSDASME